MSCRGLLSASAQRRTVFLSNNVVIYYILWYKYTGHQVLNTNLREVDPDP